MFDNFSIEARQIIFWARFEEGRLKSDSIETRHLLLGFLIQGQGKTDSHLPQGFIRVSEASMPWKRAKTETVRYFLDGAVAQRLEEELSWVGLRSDARENSADMPVSKEAQAVLETAIERADGKTLSTLHILLGILMHENERPSQCLLRHGISRERVEQAIQSET